MFIKSQRKKLHISQEQLAEQSGLSLRTIQRVETGHRVGYASLRALAVVFDINVDKLEQELYTMDNIINEYKDYPFWVRFACGRGWFSASRSELIKIELFALFFSALCCSAWLASFVWQFPTNKVPFFNLELPDFLGLGGVLCFFCAYNFSIAIRTGDKYDLWSKLEATQPQGSFGLFGKKK